jgi:hypothetical protein
MDDLTQLKYLKEARQKEKDDIQKKNKDKNLLKEKLEEAMKNPA